MTKQNIKKGKKNNNRNKNKTKIIGISIGLLLIFIIFMFAYNKSGKENSYKYKLDKPYEPAFVKNGQLAFINKQKNDTIKMIDIEIADNEQKRNQGLMWRRTMSNNTGMLFIFEEEQPLSFWMKNTYIPLDILYVNKSNEIVCIRNNTDPLSEWPIPSDKPGQYVIEVNAGFCQNYKIGVGDKVNFKDLRNEKK